MKAIDVLTDNQLARIFVPTAWMTTETDIKTGRILIVAAVHSVLPVRAATLQLVVIILLVLFVVRRLIFVIWLKIAPEVQVFVRLTL